MGPRLCWGRRLSASSALFQGATDSCVSAAGKIENKGFEPVGAASARELGVRKQR